MKRPFLILSHHRSGSNYLHNILQKHSNIESINEPFSMHTDVFRNLDLVTWYEEDYNSDFLHNSLKNYPDLIVFFKKLRTWLYQEDEIIRGFKETQLFEKLPWIGKFIPNLKIIVITRDPCAVTNSILKMKNQYINLWKYNSLIPQFAKKEFGENLNANDPIELCAWSWKMRYSKLLNNINAFDHTIVSLEELIVNPVVTLESIMSFFNCSTENQQLDYIKISHNETRGASYSSYREVNDVMNQWKGALSFENQRIIREITREELRYFGY